MAEMMQTVSMGKYDMARTEQMMGFYSFLCLRLSCLFIFILMFNSCYFLVFSGRALQFNVVLKELFRKHNANFCKTSLISGTRPTC
jgi:hypothetical protein